MPGTFKGERSHETINADEAKEVLYSFNHGTSLKEFEVFAGEHGAKIRVSLNPVVESSPQAKKGEAFQVEVVFDPSGARTADHLVIKDGVGNAVHDWSEQKGAPTSEDAMRPIANDVVREAMAGIVNKLLADKIEEANHEARS